MGLSSGFESNAIGGMGGYGIGGGFGGGGIIEGLLLGTLLNRRGGGLLGGEGGDSAALSADGIAAKTALLVNQNADQNALLNAISDNKNQTIAEGRALGAAICESEKTNLQQFYAAAIQAANNTQSIKDQATAFAIVNDKRFDDLSAAGVTQTAAILARINEAENQNLRDQLFESRRHGSNKEVEISINNSANAVQAQLQSQNQWQTQKDHDNERRFDAIFNSFNQLNRNTQDVINFGTMAASANQANQQTNVK
jgi:hypothetical protein